MNDVTEENTNKAPTSYWVLMGLALVWNLLGVMAFASHITMTAEMIAELPAAEQALYAELPQWVTIAFAVAVIGGALGCATMLLKQKAGVYILIASLIGVLVQMYHSFFISNNFEVYGPGQMVMPIMVIIIAAALVWYANKIKSKQWF
jgi:hypothetical protein